MNLGYASIAQVGRGYAPVGQTPEIKPYTQRVRVNYIASITNQGHVRFSLYIRKFTTTVLLQFMEKLIQGRRSKLFWIIDRHPVHRSLLVQQWLNEHREMIELLYLPSYSPQLNPAEYLNCDVKQGVHSKAPTRAS